MRRLLSVAMLSMVAVQAAGAEIRELTIQHRYLHLPVRTGAPKHRVAAVVDGSVVREFEIELADDPGWWAHLDVGAWRGRKLLLRVEGAKSVSRALAMVEQAEEIWAPDQVYREPLRGQLHFSPRRGWNNDPNGLVYSAGAYHLYFQHNPYGWAWGNMHWGHAVSPDLVHWREQPIAIYPHRFGDWAFSGSAVVDRENTSGWRRGAGELLVAAYTSTGRGECVVYSNDQGQTWTEFDGNPVVRHQGRDPRLLWHAPSHQWVMAVYDEDQRKRWIAFYTSPDLKAWTYRSRIEGFYECPDLFELPVDGGRRWVLTAASSEYMVGTFDGTTFRPETARLPGHRGRGYYAAQTFSNDPGGRVVQVGWLQANTPGMPFNQAMSLPMELSLKGDPGGPRLAWRPVDELKLLRGRSVSIPGTPGRLASGESGVTVDVGELVELRAEIEPDPASVVTVEVRGVAIVLDAAKGEIRVEGLKAPAPLREGRQRLIVYADRIGLEIFADDGRAFLPVAVNLDPSKTAVGIRVEGGPARVVAIEAHELKSLWGTSANR